MKHYPIILIFLCFPFIGEANSCIIPIKNKQTNIFQFPRNPAMKAWFETNIAHNPKREYEILKVLFSNERIRIYPSPILNRFLILSILQGRVEINKKKFVSPIPGIDKDLIRLSPKTYKALFFKIKEFNLARKGFLKNLSTKNPDLDFKIVEKFKPIISISYKITQIWRRKQFLIRNSIMPQSRFITLLTSLNKARAENNLKKIRLIQFRLHNLHIKFRQGISFPKKTNSVLESIRTTLSKLAKLENKKTGLRSFYHLKRFKSFLLFSENPKFLFSKPKTLLDKETNTYLSQFLEGATVALEELQILLANKGEIPLALKIERVFKTISLAKQKHGFKTIKAALIKAFRLPALQIFIKFN